jgi:hypothetical protein
MGKQQRRSNGSWFGSLFERIIQRPNLARHPPPLLSVPCIDIHTVYTMGCVGGGCMGMCVCVSVCVIQSHQLRSVAQTVFFRLHTRYGENTVLVE